MTFRVGVLAFLFAFCAAGCGGSGGGVGKPPVVPPSHDMGDIRFTIVVPNQTAIASAHVGPSYISSNAHTLVLTVNGGTPQIFGLTPSTDPNCSTTSGTTTCSNLDASAPFGTDTLSFQLDQEATPLPASPTVLATTVIANEQVLEGVANQLGTFTLNPVIGSISFSLSEPSGGFQPGTASSGNAINVLVKDPSGATVIAPGTYVTASDAANPIGLTSSQGAFTFSVDGASAAATGSLSGPSNAATLGYSGATVAATTTISATAGAITASQTIAALQAPITATLTSSASGNDYHVVTAPPELDFYATGITGTIALAENGYAGSFTLQSDTCNTTDDASATGNYLSFSPGKGQSGSSFTVSANAAGTSANPAICTATFTDANGQTLSVTLSVTTISFGLQ
ncbi:MAG: hypothetical protein KGN02_05895 [bacterium]|nr:hypothetical protein [bacterium]